MKIISTIQLENLFKDKVKSRNMIDNTKAGRIIECVEFLNRKILIKYGSDTALEKEAYIYQEILSKSKKYPVPKLLVKQKINDNRLLAIEWIEGIHPDFENKTHIEGAFKSLGKWAADMSSIVESNIEKDPLSNFGILESLLKDYENKLTRIVEHPLIDLLNHCVLQSESMIKNIKMTPLTLNPGDISRHNIIVTSDAEFTFIDFESYSLSPMVTLVEHLGENYESIPNKNSNVHLALKSYLNSWNEVVREKIDWDDFVHYQLCSRIYYKVGNFNYWFKRILEGKDSEQTLAWIKQGHEQLELLLLKYMNS